MDHSGLANIQGKVERGEKWKYNVYCKKKFGKKRTASGVHHKTGKRGYVGKMLFPTDMLKGKEKRSYQKHRRWRFQICMKQ